LSSLKTNKTRALKGKNMLENLPSKGWDSKSKEDRAIKFRNANPQTLEEVMENFDFLPQAFGFTDVQGLVFKVYAKIKLLKTYDEFNNFCIKHHALTKEGKIGTGKTLKGAYVPWAYALFRELWNIAQNRESKRDYAEQKSWDELAQMASDDFPLF